MPPMNIIYFNPDEMRADVLGCYGHPLVRTPNIDRLAAEGTRFDQCHVQHTVCSPSRCSFMTGWYPHTSGHRTLWNLLKPHEPNTMRYLRDAGYNVQWWGKNDLLNPAAGDNSVTRVHEVSHAGLDRGGDICEPGEAAFQSFLRSPQQSEHIDQRWIDGACEWLRTRDPRDAEPFMVFLSTSYPHCPYTCPQPWYDMYDPADMPDRRPAELPDKPDFYHLIRKYRGIEELDDATWRKIQAVYLGMVSYVDHMFGQLLQTLDETGLAENTAICFFSDHGDWAGEYGLPEKWPSGLDDCLTRIPMIWRVPGGQQGHSVAEPVECFDIMPTTLELAGVDCAHTHFARSMVPQVMAGKTGDPDRAVIADGGYDPHEPHCFEGRDHAYETAPNAIYAPKSREQQEVPESVCRATMLRTATHKLVWRPLGVNELYDLRADPDELRNVFDHPDYVAVQARLTARLLDHYVHTADVTPFVQDFRGFVFENRA